VVRSLDWWGVGLALLAQVLSYVGSGYLLQAVVALTGQRLPLLAAVEITLAASSVGLVSAGILGDAAASYRWTRTYGIRPAGALLGSWMPTLFNLCLLFALALLGLADLLLLHALSSEEAWGFGGSLAALVCAAALAVWTVVRPERIARVLAWLSERLPGVPRIGSATVEEGFRRLSGAFTLLRHGGWRRVLLGALGNTGFDLLTLYLLFHAAGSPLPPDVLTTGYGLPLLLGKVVLLPGGLGAVEGGMVALYHALGVPVPTAVLVVLSYRAISFWLPTLVGVPLVPLLERRTLRGPAPASDAR